MGEDQLRALTRRAADGQPRAWQALQDRYDPLVWAVVGRFTLSFADQTEIRDEVWSALHEHLPRLQCVDALPGWLRTTTQRACLRRRRRVVREVPLADIAEHAVDFSTPESYLLADEEIRGVRLAVERLPPRCRAVISQWIVDDDYRQVAAAMGIAPSSVGPTKTRCMRLLRKHYFDVMGE